MTKYETDIWPYVEARDYLKEVRAKTRLIVIHTAETKESALGAENVAKYFQHPDYPSSAHVCVDNDSIVQCVKDSYVAYGAKGANHDGVHIELCCYMGQTKTQWIDNYSLGLLALGASVAAQYCLKFGVQVKHLTNAELFAGKAGLVGHDQVSAVYHQTDHQDPGLNFPWQLFMAQVQELYLLRK